MGAALGFGGSHFDALANLAGPAMTVEYERRLASKWLCHDLEPMTLRKFCGATSPRQTDTRARNSHVQSPKRAALALGGEPQVAAARRHRSAAADDRGGMPSIRHHPRGARRLADALPIPWPGRPARHPTAMLPADHVTRRSEQCRSVKR